MNPICSPPSIHSNRFNELSTSCFHIAHHFFSVLSLVELRLLRWRLVTGKLSANICLLYPGMRQKSFVKSVVLDWQPATITPTAKPFVIWSSSEELLARRLSDVCGVVRCGWEVGWQTIKKTDEAIYRPCNGLEKNKQFITDGNRRLKLL